MVEANAVREDLERARAVGGEAELGPDRDLLGQILAVDNVLRRDVVVAVERDGKLAVVEQIVLRRLGRKVESSILRADVQRDLQASRGLPVEMTTDDVLRAVGRGSAREQRSREQKKCEHLDEACRRRRPKRGLPDDLDDRRPVPKLACAGLGQLRGRLGCLVCELSSDQPAQSHGR